MTAYTQNRNRNVTLFLLSATVLVVITGLVLFLKFHVGPGAHAVAWGGLSRAVWLNMHRTAAIATVVLMAWHLVRHKRLVIALLPGFGRQGQGRGARARHGQSLLLVLMGVVIVAAFSAWLLGSIDGRSNRLHHPLIDVHNVSSILFAAGVTLHVARRHHRIL